VLSFRRLPSTVLGLAVSGWATKVQMSRQSVTVGVVVPMFNAERTIGETLSSITRQTYEALDIVVVDDGSTDGSAAIVAAHAERDRRIRLLRQANGGVAAARNFGAAATDAEFLAFVDADDLWGPPKIELQMKAIREGGPAVGLVYCWFAQIDEEGRVFSLKFQPRHEGHVLVEMCRQNFVGNGSSMLVRRSAFQVAGGFDPSLRARNAQGCEDLLLCLRIAEHCEFRVVTRHLVGYRITNSNMSSDVMQMFRSCEMVLAEYRQKYPQFAPDLDVHLINMTQWLAIRALIGGKFIKACVLMKNVFLAEPRLAIFRLTHMLDVYFRSRLVPRWMKAPAKRLLKKEADFRPIYRQANW